MNIIKITGKFPLLAATVLALTANVEAQSSLSDGLLAYYPFSGNSEDATGNGHDGVVTDAVLTTNRFGQANSAYAFNGTNSMIVVSNSADLQPLQDFSVSVWADVVRGPVNPYQENVSSPLIGKTFAGQDINGWLLQVVRSEPVESLTNTELWLSFVAAPILSYPFSPHINIPTNKWFQAVFTFQPTSAFYQTVMGICNFYLNGVLEDSRIEQFEKNNDTNLLIMGAVRGYNSIYPYHFDGLLDDIRIYDRALSSNDVQQLYTEEAGPPAQPQVDTHKAIHLEFSHLTVGVQYQLQFSRNRHRWLDAGVPFTATATTQSETVDADHFNARDVDWRLQIAP